MKRFVFFMALLCAAGVLNISAVDFGAVLSGQLELDKAAELDPDGKIILAPWLSIPIGNNGNFYFSPGLELSFPGKDKDPVFIPELKRLDFTWQLPQMFLFRLGRIPWQDTSRFTAKGSFDGIDIVLDAGIARLGACALYTGLLYKDSAELNISPGDPTDYTADLDWSNFSSTYFAPRRLLLSAYGDIPGLLFQRGTLAFGFLAQFDISDAEEAFHTQYFLLRYSMSYRRFDLAASGAAELENTSEDGLRAGFAAALETGWNVSPITDRLSLTVRWASGNGPHSAAFFPLIREAQGLVLKPWLSGMMLIALNYEARILPSLSAEFGGRYFIRTDSTSFIDPALNNDSYLIGMEIDGGLVWVPLSDLSFSLSGGVFMPKTGEAMKDDTPVRWSLVLGTVFSF